METLREAIRAEVMRYAPQCSICEVRGSWRSGSFHYDRQGHISFSDVDVYCAGDCPEMQSVLVTPSLPLGIRRSIRKEPYIDTLVLDDSRLLCIFLLGQVTNRGRTYFDYIHAKVGLLLLRESTAEDYTDVVDRTKTEDTVRALELKLGSFARSGRKAVKPTDLFLTMELAAIWVKYEWGELARRLFYAPYGSSYSESTEVWQGFLPALRCVDSVSREFTAAIAAKAGVWLP